MTFNKDSKQNKGKLSISIKDVLNLKKSVPTVPKYKAPF